jgi:predicted RNA-binding Zn-ribbon protein involved in translation (DUF1610 family)
MELKIQSKGRGELASKNPKEGWKDSNLEEVFLHANIARDVIRNTRDTDHPIEMFEEEAIKEQLKEGKIIYMPLIMFRAVVGDKTCPLCGATFEGLGALSRKDNATEICSDCGTNEAMEDMFAEKK